MKLAWEEKCFNSYFCVRGMFPEETLKFEHWWLLPIRWHRKGQVLSLTPPSRWGFWVWLDPCLRNWGAKKMWQSKQISSHQSSAVLDLGMCAEFRCLHPISTGSTSFWDSPLEPASTVRQCFFFFFWLQVVEVYSRKNSLDGVGCFSITEQEDVFHSF